MNIRPTLEELRGMNLDGFTVAPISCEILSDFTTPIEALRTTFTSSPGVKPSHALVGTSTAFFVYSDIPQTPDARQRILLNS